MRKKAAALVVALVVVLVVVLIAAASPHRCFLDVLNAQIAQQTEFEPFYAASDRRWGLPTPGEVVPGLERLDAAYPIIRAEMEAAVFGNQGAAGQPAGRVSDPAGRVNDPADRASNAAGRVSNAAGRASNAAEQLADNQRVDALPPMHELYNNIFLFKGSGARPGALQRLARPLQRAWGTLVYGRDTDIFDRIGSDDWRTFNLLLFGRPVPGNAEKCPRTVQLLQSVPGVQSALFSVVKPGAYIPPHSDPAKGVVRYHLALRVPRPVTRAGGPPERRCFIEVDCARGRGCARDDARHRYRWAEGESVLFDDVFPHWVHNDTDEVRVILFVDVLRPLAGAARALQGVANFANRHHPGVRRLIRESRV